MSAAKVVGVSAAPGHDFSKPARREIRLLAGLGVEGDAHAGVTVQHRSRVTIDPTRPNLRQVHLLHRELLDQLAERGFQVFPGAVGENITTEGVDLLALPTGARIRFPSGAEIEITGLRNPCAQLERFQKGLTAAMLSTDGKGGLVRLAGIMAIVTRGGTIAVDDEISVRLPVGDHVPLRPV